MKGYAFILVGLIFLYSCGKQKTNYFQDESKVVNEEINYNLGKIQLKYLENPEMAKPYFEIANYLKTSFDSIMKFADQGNKTKFHNRLEELHNTIKSNSYFNSRYINQIIIPNRFNKWIDNAGESNSFENMDVVRLELLNLENELTDYLSNRIEADYYKFNKLQAMVADSSDNLKVGETYCANIFLAAFDTTKYPLIMVTDSSLPDSILSLDKRGDKRLFDVDVIDGKGIYKTKVSKPGKHGFKGAIWFPNSNGEMEKFMFSKVFTVRR